MNKFITFALLAFCATVAHSQVIPGNLPLNYWSDYIVQNNGGGSSSAAAASAAASSSSSNQNSQLIQSRLNPGLIAPYGAIPAPILGANPWIPQGYSTPLGAPWVQQGWPVGVNPLLAPVPFPAYPGIAL